MAISSSPSQVEISNDHLAVQLCLPDARTGLYRGTRFDWSGVVSGLQYHGHRYYAPWYTKRDPKVPDYVDDGIDIVVGRQSAITGPAEEFPEPQGFETAKAGETFVKLGVGVLRKAADASYSCYESYEIVDPGTWSVRATAGAVEFTHQLTDAKTGFGYVYRKSVSLVAGRPDLVIHHSLQNTGKAAITTDQYNHNFLTVDGESIGPDFLISLPFRIQTPSAVDQNLAAVWENKIRFVKTLVPGDVVSFPIQGFGQTPSDYDICVENRKAGTGLRITGNRPLTKLSLWSIRSVVSIEPFVDVGTEPGGHTVWTYTYTHYVIDT